MLSFYKVLLNDDNNIHEPYTLARHILEENGELKNSIVQSIYNMASEYARRTKNKSSTYYNELYDITVKFEGSIDSHLDLKTH